MSDVKNSEENPAKRKGLIVSISDYNDKNLQQRDFCKNDGEKMYEVLKSLNYEIPDHFKLIGTVGFYEMRNAIMNFFKDENNNWDDTLLFYFSGHGVPDGYGDVFLSTSEIDIRNPDVNGFSFDELTRQMGKSRSKRLITVLDCCYSGKAKVAKGGSSKTIAKEAKQVMEETFENKRSQNRLGRGKCLMASSLEHQESLALKKDKHSLFTYYLLEGLKGGGGQTVDGEGHVTPSLLGEYIDDKMMSLPKEKRPDQTPLVKSEISGKFILAEHPELAKRSTQLDIQIDTSWSLIEQGKQRIEIEDFDNAIKFLDEAIGANPKNAVAYNYKGDVFFGSKNFEEAINWYDKALFINPNDFDVIKDKGLALHKLGRYNEAVEFYSKVLESSSGVLETRQTAKIWSFKGVALEEAGKKKDALDSYDKALVLDPKNDEALNAKDSLVASSFYGGVPESHWNIILGKFEDRKVTPIIGPRVYEDWLPSLAKIAKEWAEEYGYQGEESDVLAKVSQFLEFNNEFPKVRLSEELRKILPPNFDVPEYKDTPYAILAELPCPIYITTNYDNFMEKALKDKGRNPVTEFCRWDPDAAFDFESVVKKSKYSPEIATPLVYHLHGILDIPESMVLTEKDYRNFVSNLKIDRLLPQVVEIALAQTSLLFIGYDTEDALFRFIFDGLSILQNPKREATSIAVKAVPSLGKSRPKLKEQFTTSEDRIRGVCDPLASYAKAMFNVLVCWGNSQQFLEDLRGRWYRSRKIEPSHDIAIKEKELAVKRLEESLKPATDSFQKTSPIEPPLIQANENLENVKPRSSQFYQVKEQTEEKKEEKYGRRHAIVIGINRYEYDSDIQTLGGAENDAKEIYDRLHRNGDFEISNTHFLLGPDATKKNILEAFSDIFRKEVNYDIVAIYFSCHAILDENNVCYIAPYDMDPKDPHVNGINLKELGNLINGSKNQASVVIFLDCCHRGIAFKDKLKSGPVTTTVMDTNRDLISTQFQKMVESPNQPGTQATDRGRVILASSEANAVSKERNYVHSDDDKPHSHGAFTFHLIEGIDGKASDKSGVITIGSLKKYVEDEMLKEDRQIPVHYVAGASRIDSIHVAISQNRFQATIDKLVETAQGLVVVKYPNSDLIDIQYLTIAAKKVSELANLEPNNEELPLLYKIINDGTASFSQPTIEWLSKNSKYARRKLNEIEPGLYDFRLPDMVQNLTYDELQKMDQTTLRTLTILLAEVARNTEFKAEDDKNLNSLYLKLRASLHNNFNATRPGHV